MSPLTFIDTNPQGAPEWYAARVGRITGSKAHLARKVGGLTKQQAKYVDALQSGLDQSSALLAAGYKKAPSAEAVSKALAGMEVGEWGDQSKKYAFRLAVERITGQPLDEGFAGNFFTKRGKRLEEEARMIYELRHEVIVDECGAVCTTDGKFAASADGLIGNDEGWECKAFLDPSMLMPMILDGDFSEIRDQCLMGLWLSGRKRWNATLYVPALEVIGKDLTVCTIDRSADGVEDEIEQLEADLLALDALVEDYRARLMAGATPKEILTDEQQPELFPPSEPAAAFKLVSPGDIASITF
jgi:hypothetical protein